MGRSERGLSMVLALVAVLILSLAAIALVRSIDTGALIVGNIGFKQDATEVSAIGAERAMAWIEAHLSGTSLESDHSDAGYYASSLDKLDPTGTNTSAENPLPLVNWDGNCQNAAAGSYSACSVLPFTSTEVNGNTLQWVITRLCDTVGAASAANLCSRPVVVATSNASDRGDLSAGGRISGTVAGPYYRIIVRATGPRNTVSFTETIVHY
jgi:Tfp pilus assembly protein PilX